MVGETSILSAAGMAFLEACPKVRFVEGAFGWLLLREDVTRRPVRFGFGGRARVRAGWGWGVEVDPAALERLSAGRPRTMQV
jgi:muconate cycloisomerase